MPVLATNRQQLRQILAVDIVANSVDIVANTVNFVADTVDFVADTVDFVADTVDFIASVYGAKATRSTFNKVDHTEFNFVASVYRT